MALKLTQQLNPRLGVNTNGLTTGNTGDPKEPALSVGNSARRGSVGEVVNPGDYCITARRQGNKMVYLISYRNSEGELRHGVVKNPGDFNGVDQYFG